MVNNNSNSLSINSQANHNLAKYMNRKQSYERLIKLDQQLYNLYKQAPGGDRIRVHPENHQVRMPQAA